MTEFPSPKLQKIESALVSLSATEQLWLLDFLIQQLREVLSPQWVALSQGLPMRDSPVVVKDLSLKDQEGPDRELEAMAASFEIQRELRAIDADFGGTEWDGLEAV